MSKTTKLDSRVIRSQRDLANALEELLQKKNLDDISITEITNTALVSKNTFYNNFFDKNDLLNFLFQRYANEIGVRIENIIKTGTQRDSESVKEGIRAIIHYFYSSQTAFGKMIRNDKSKALYWSLNSFIQKMTDEVFKEYAPIIALDVPGKIVGYVYAGAITNFIYYMLSDDEYINEEDCVHYIEEMTTKSLFRSKR